MILYLTGKTIYPKSEMDFIELVKPNGETIFVDWDESEYEFNADGSFTARMKGVYFNDKYANGLLNELSDATISHIQFCSNEENKVNNIDIISIMEFDDGMDVMIFDIPYACK